MTLHLELPGSGGKLDRLLGEFGAVALPGPPDWALICVVDMGDYEAPGYITTEIELTAWAGRILRGGAPGSCTAYGRYRMPCNRPHLRPSASI
jgi:hypothetical protein